MTVQDTIKSLREKHGLSQDQLAERVMVTRQAVRCSVKFPSKVTPYQASILAKFPVVLSCLEIEDMKPDALYKKVKSKVSDVGEFLEILDCLYALGKVELYEEGGMLHYVN